MSMNSIIINEGTYVYRTQQRHMLYSMQSFVQTLLNDENDLLNCTKNIYRYSPIIFTTFETSCPIVIRLVLYFQILGEIAADFLKFIFWDIAFQIVGYTRRAIAVDFLKFIFWDIGCQIVGYTGRKYQIAGYTGLKYNLSKSGMYSRHNLNSVFC